MQKTATQSPANLRETVQLALAEDMGSGDITAHLIDAQKQTQASILSREHAILCGSPWASEVFRQLDPGLQVHWLTQDGDCLAPTQTLCNLQGNARTLLSGERTALNFLQTLSATATTTHQYVKAIAGTNCRILDTRKTLPGLRAAQKYAVHCGGGSNHRHGLFDAFLIKENHIAATGSISVAIKRARQLHPEHLLEVEVENLIQLEEALTCKPDRILLDNFAIPDVRTAVNITRHRIPLEVSGNINLSNIRVYAETGIAYISIGDLTKNINAIDLSMRFTN